VFFSFKYHFSFSVTLTFSFTLSFWFYFRFRFSYSFGGIFVLVLTCMLMWYDQWLSKSVKVKNAVSATYLLLFYNTKKQVTLQFTVHWVQCRMWPFSFRNTRLYWDILVLFRFLAVISPHSENNQSFNIGLTGRRCHKIKCQLRQSLVPGLAIQPKLSPF